jgi:hypothetical protein
MIFADDISVIICNQSDGDFSSMSYIILSHMIKWFTASKKTLHLEETNIMQFIINFSHIIH